VVVPSAAVPVVVVVTIVVVAMAAIVVAVVAPALTTVVVVPSAAVPVVVVVTIVVVTPALTAVVIVPPALTAVVTVPPAATPTLVVIVAVIVVAVATAIVVVVVAVAVVVVVAIAIAGDDGLRTEVDPGPLGEPVGQPHGATLEAVTHRKRAEAVDRAVARDHGRGAGAITDTLGGAARSEGEADEESEKARGHAASRRRRKGPRTFIVCKVRTPPVKQDAWILNLS